jgi:hypothetical protein
MKTFLLLCLLFLSVTVSFAQIHKGSLLVGGNVGFSAGNTKFSNPSLQPSKTIGISVFPTAGKAVKENAVLGLSLGYGRNTSTSGDYKNRSEAFEAGLFYKKFLHLGKGFLLYGQGSANFNRQYIKSSGSFSNPAKTTSTSAGLNFSAGIAYLAGRRFFLEMGLNQVAGFGYSEYKMLNPANPPYNSKNKRWEAWGAVSGASPLTLGFSFLLKNK